MLVIHPEDRTTAPLSLLYEGIPLVEVLGVAASERYVSERLRRQPQSEVVMLLGHGCDAGLFSRSDDAVAEFDRLIVRHKHSYYLRRLRVIGIWCHAYDFAVKERLHGLFTGMFITEMDEAQIYNVVTTEEELYTEFVKFAKRLRWLLDRETPLHEIPELLRKMDDVQSSLTRFNYDSVYYI